MSKQDDGHRHEARGDGADIVAALKSFAGLDHPRGLPEKLAAIEGRFAAALGLPEDLATRGDAVELALTVETALATMAAPFLKEAFDFGDGENADGSAVAAAVAGNHILLVLPLVAMALAGEEAAERSLAVEDHIGRTLMHVAAGKGAAATLAALLGLGDGALARRRDHSQRLPLAAAALGGHIECVKLLLAAAPEEIDAADAAGTTALGAAAFQLKKPTAPIIHLLLGEGAANNPAQHPDALGKAIQVLGRADEGMVEDVLMRCALLTGLIELEGVVAPRAKDLRAFHHAVEEQLKPRIREGAWTLYLRVMTAALEKADAREAGEDAGAPTPSAVGERPVAGPIASLPLWAQALASDDRRERDQAIERLARIDARLGEALRSVHYYLAPSVLAEAAYGIDPTADPWLRSSEDNERAGLSGRIECEVDDDDLSGTEEEREVALALRDAFGLSSRGQLPLGAAQLLARLNLPALAHALVFAQITMEGARPVAGVEMLREAAAAGAFETAWVLARHLPPEQILEADAAGASALGLAVLGGHCRTAQLLAKAAVNGSTPGDTLLGAAELELALSLGSPKAVRALLIGGVRPGRTLGSGGARAVRLMTSGDAEVAREAAKALSFALGARPVWDALQPFEPLWARSNDDEVERLLGENAQACFESGELNAGVLGTWANLRPFEQRAIAAGGAPLLEPLPTRISRETRALAKRVLEAALGDRRTLLDDAEQIGQYAFGAAQNGATTFLAALVLSGVKPPSGNWLGPVAIGSTLLHAAADGGNFAATRFLLARGANPMVIDANDNTAMHLAANQGHYGCLLAMLEARPEGVRERDLNDLTVFRQALESGDMDLPRLILQRHGDELAPGLGDDARWCQELFACGLPVSPTAALLVAWRNWLRAHGLNVEDDGHSGFIAGSRLVAADYPELAFDAHERVRCVAWLDDSFESSASMMPTIHPLHLCLQKARESAASGAAADLAAAARARGQWTLDELVALMNVRAGRGRPAGEIHIGPADPDEQAALARDEISMLGAAQSLPTALLLIEQLSERGIGPSDPQIEPVVDGAVRAAVFCAPAMLEDVLARLRLLAGLSAVRRDDLLTAQMLDEDDRYESVYRGAPGAIGPLLSKALKDPEIEAALTSRRDRRFVLEALGREINAARARAVGRARRRA